MNKPLIILPLVVSVISCSTLKKTATPAASTNSSKSAPEFLETISIKHEKQQSKQETVKTNPFVAQTKLTDTAQYVELEPLPVEFSESLQFKYAILLNVPVEEITNKYQIQFIESWYGVPYRMGGIDRKGVDCSAFTQSFIASLYGLSIARTSREQYANCTRIKKDELDEGDLVFFYTTRRKVISHVGVYLRNNKFVHASTSSGVMISDLSDDYFARRFMGAGRVR
jgi:cell wall-associated NlpC family hydrolase